MELICMAGMLIYMSYEDIRRKTIPVIPLMIWGIVGVAQHLIYGRLDAISMAAGLIPGILAYILSVLTHERIGKGDALLLLVTGIYMGFWGNVFMLWVALIMAAVGGVTAVAVFGKDRNSELPFVPFLSAAGMLLLMTNGGMPT